MEEHFLSVQPILLLYSVLLLGNTNKLVSNQLRDLIESNVYVQHIIGFCVIYIIINTLSPKSDTRINLVYAVIYYIIFVMITKTDIHWTIVILTGMLFVFIMENNRKRYTYIYILLVCLIIIGTSFYILKKNKQYNNSFDFVKYIFA